MKRTPLKRKTPLKTQSKGLQRRALRQISKSPVAGYKRRIQAALRAIVIKRDGGCIMRNYPEAGNCNTVLQADHIITRANSSTFADPRNAVCLCSRHHIFWKKQYPMLWQRLVFQHIGPERVRWIEMMERMSTKPYRMYQSEWAILADALEKDAEMMEKEVGMAY